MLDSILFRAIFVLISGFTAAYFRPVHTPFWAAALAGVFIAGVAIAIETRIRRISLERLLGIAGGATIGLIGAALVSLVLGRLGAETSPTLHFVQVICLLLLVYFGAVTGAAKGQLLNLSAFGGVFGSEKHRRTNAEDSGYQRDYRRPYRRHRRHRISRWRAGDSAVRSA